MNSHFVPKRPTPGFDFIEPELTVTQEETRVHTPSARILPTEHEYSPPGAVDTAMIGAVVRRFLAWNR